MMLFDINTAVGHWPFRQVPHESPSELRALLTEKGIAGAAVAHTHGLFYLNCHDANLELAEAISGHADFFVGVATLNPMYAAWERDLRACREKLGLRALRLAPQYHGYRLGCPESLAIARAAAELALPVLVPHRVVDVRGRHWFDTEETVGFGQIAAFCEAVPETKVIVTEGSFDADHLLSKEGSFRCPNLHLELSRARDGLCNLPAAIAAEHMLFGTGAPLKSISPALLKLELADVDDLGRQHIGWHNARRLLGLESGAWSAAGR
jgi:predicted TIM-barrel fold metal-dependent hydrolase